MSNIKLATINKAIAALGGKEILVKGSDYFYFTEGEAFKWERSSVYVVKLSQLTLEQWIEEYNTLKSPENKYAIYR